MSRGEVSKFWTGRQYFLPSFRASATKGSAA
nr:MAG TPA: hypothetical protein [Caudoviricetes sp.]